ncbi:hypothetical protein Dda_7502 [Drechslerella dactyloides]|uniref:Uncharacterized protein n=1 Tax=Drechslerella dactyloides TaxID=74499 RepID=A0AAD6ISC4_DREDA|nr:hypothetical protein Dda_7502 [Drechslerella dactyloides]
MRGCISKLTSIEFTIMAAPMVPFIPEEPPPSEEVPTLVSSHNFLDWVWMRPQNQEQPPGLSCDEVLSIVASTSDPVKIVERAREAVRILRLHHGEMRQPSLCSIQTSSYSPTQMEYQAREYHEWPPIHPHAILHRYKLKELPRHIPVHVKLVEPGTIPVASGFTSSDDIDMWISLESLPEAADEGHRVPELPFDAYRRFTEFRVDGARRRYYVNAVYTRPENLPRATIPKIHDDSTCPYVCNIQDQQYLWLGYRIPATDSSLAHERNSVPQENSQDTVMVLTQHRYLGKPEWMYLSRHEQE